eukprot:scaffold50096_cov63-Phaeocystis_antarctica.AAC.4
MAFLESQLTHPLGRRPLRALAPARGGMAQHAAYLKQAVSGNSLEDAQRSCVQHGEDRVHALRAAKRCLEVIAAVCLLAAPCLTQSGLELCLLPNVTGAQGDEFAFEVGHLHVLDALLDTCRSGRHRKQGLLEGSGRQL